mmetsp:Transcript_41161/g.131737  ORF Transcript_41161/g.131737 Transcript_41161/m.131737 type:complete len:357 (+) Transcript_41161:322-1392(+)
MGPPCSQSPFYFTSSEPQSSAKPASMPPLTLMLIVSWYLSNIGVILLNKYLLSIYGFKFPIFLTMLHMIACSLMSYAVSLLGLVPRQSVRSGKQFMKIVVLSCVFCLSVVGGNISLRYIPVSFNQAIGATTPMFTALFSVLILGKVETKETYLALVPVVVGIVLASNSEPLFHLTGFLVCMSATAARALKSVLQGLLLSSDVDKLNSMNLLLYMAPVSVVVLLPFVALMESNPIGQVVANMKESPHFLVLLFLNCFMAYFVNLTNFLVTKHTSALTLQVLGNAKGVVAVVVSILIFRNPVSATGMVGYTITVFGVIMYSEAKKRTGKQAAPLPVEHTDVAGEGGMLPLQRHPHSHV